MLRKILIFYLFTGFAFLNSSLTLISAFSYGLIQDASNFQSPTSKTGGTSGALLSSQVTNPSTIPPSLRIFTSIFKTAVDSSPLLPITFSLDETDIHAFAHFLYNAMYTQVYRGFYDPNDLASYANEPITEKSTLLTYPMLVNMYTNTIGYQLLSEGILTDKNAASLAYGCVKEMEIAAQKVGGLNTTASKFQALTDGFICILKYVGLFTPDNLHAVGRYLSKEIRLADGGPSSKKDAHVKKWKRN